MFVAARLVAATTVYRRVLEGEHISDLPAVCAAAAAEDLAGGDRENNSETKQICIFLLRVPPNSVRAVLCFWSGFLYSEKVVFDFSRRTPRPFSAVSKPNVFEFIC